MVVTAKSTGLQKDVHELKNVSPLPLKFLYCIVSHVMACGLREFVQQSGGLCSRREPVFV